MKSKHDHCFQRIVLDNICGCAWYEVILSPAYQHLSIEQAEAAVNLCLNIINGDQDLALLNKHSLRWRQKQQTLVF